MEVHGNKSHYRERAKISSKEVHEFKIDNLAKDSFSNFEIAKNLVALNRIQVVAVKVVNL